MKIKVNVKQGIIQWEDIIGVEFIHNDTKVVCSGYSDDSLYINEWVGEDVTGKTSVISTVDKNKCLAHLKIFGYEIEFVSVFAFSNETVQKAKGLVQAGFSKLIKTENNYMVDNIFQQNILLENELNYLLENSISEISLSEII